MSNNQFFTFLILMLTVSIAFSQEKTVASIKDLSFLEGKWEAMAKDSSFSSVLEYRYSREERLLMATNYLYGKQGQPFGTYEGAYFLEVDKFAYFIAGPKGETHRGSAIIRNDTITHLARLLPGKSVKSYRSEMILDNGKLYYYASYSSETEFPVEVDYLNPLIYVRIE